MSTNSLRSHLRSRYHNGAESTYSSQDNKEGVEIKYWTDGRVAVVSFFHDNKRDGLYRSFHKDGSIAAISSWKHGKQHGYHGEFESTGELAFDLIFVNGKPEGILRFYTPDRIELITYANGKKNGVRGVYDRDGRPISQEIYKDDVKVQ